MYVCMYICVYERSSRSGSYLRSSIQVVPIQEVSFREDRPDNEINSKL
jgi:hypothetical protein